MTSADGVMLLGQVDRKLGLMDAVARCIADLRCPLQSKHGVRDILRQRVYRLALDGEVPNDHGALPQAIDLEGDVLMPGFIEVHSDNFERHLMPRPKVQWAETPALPAHDAEIAAGITTV